jgi:type IV secretory pathway VirJ component
VNPAIFIPRIKYNMPKSKSLLLFVMFCAFFIGSVAAKKEFTPLPGFKKVWVYGNTVNPSGLVIILSGDGGWVLGVVDVANALAQQNIMVVGVNTVSYLRYVRKQPGDCYNLSDDFQRLEKYIQKKYQVKSYHPPIIMGYSLGATFAYGILAQSIPGTFKGAVSLGFCYDYDTPKPLCPGAGLENRKRPGKGFDLLPSGHLKDPFVVIQGADDKTCPFCLAKKFSDETVASEIIRLPHIRHGSLSLRKWIPAILEACDRIMKL